MAAAKYKDWIGESGRILLTAWAMNGLSDEQIASNMGISTRTLYIWKNEHPEIARALETGRVVADMQVVNALFKNAVGYWEYERTIERSEDGKNVFKLEKKYVEPNVKAQIFWLKNRRPDKWKDKPDGAGEAAERETIENIQKLLSRIRSAF